MTAYKHTRTFEVTTYELCAVCGLLKQGVALRTRYAWWAMPEGHREMLSCMDCFEHDKESYQHYTGDFNDYDEGY